MRARPYVVFFLAPVLAYLTLLFLVAALVVHPSSLGWIGFGVVAAVGLAIGGAAAVLYPRSRTNARRAHPRADTRPFRLLVVADTHCADASLCDAVETELRGRRGETFVLAPLLASPLHFVTDDETQEREDAQARLVEALHALARRGVEARGAVGDDDPLQAIGDALDAFPASEILLVAPEQRDRRWLELDLERRARDAYGVHVATRVVVADAAVGGVDGRAS